MNDTFQKRFAYLFCTVESRKTFVEIWVHTVYTEYYIIMIDIITVL